MDMKSLAEHNKKRWGEYLTASWYFDKWYEKVILIVMGILSLVKVLEFLW